MQQLPTGVESVGELPGHWLALNFADLCRTFSGIIEAGAAWYLPLRTVRYDSCRVYHELPLYPNYVFVAGDRETVGLQVREAVRAFGGMVLNTLIPASQTQFRKRLIEIESELRRNPFTGADTLPSIGQLVECVSGPLRGLRGGVTAVNAAKRVVSIGLDNGILIDQPADAVELVS